MSQAKKKEEKQKAEEAAKKATGIKTFQEPSDTEEDSPKRPAHSARQARVMGRSLFQELNEMASGSKPRK